MKKGLTVLMTVILALSLSACGLFSQEQDQQEPATSQVSSSEKEETEGMSEEELKAYTDRMQEEVDKLTDQDIEIQPKDDTIVITVPELARLVPKKEKQKYLDQLLEKHREAYEAKMGEEKLSSLPPILVETPSGRILAETSKDKEEMIVK